MLDYQSIKEMAKVIGRPTKELLALAPVNAAALAFGSSRSLIGGPFRRPMNERHYEDDG